MNQVTLDHLRSVDTRLNRRLESSKASAADLISLLRGELVARGYAALNIADGPLKGLPDDAWALHGMTVRDGCARPRRWQPSWLDHHGVLSPDEYPARREYVRPRTQVPVDQFYARVLDRREYTNPAQRDAVRALAVANGGDVVTCVMPTGSGKSDVFLARAILARPKQTVVIVPTTSLAQDLERRVNQIPGCTGTHAYTGDLSAGVKQLFISRISQGDQWLTITSPEAACTVLAQPLRDAALRGSLDLIVIDEAHMVAEWGEAFRPAFQLFAGLYRTLIDESPPGRAPVTALLTGTLDNYARSTLRRLFVGTHEVLISGQYTRPEPAWWFAECADEANKADRLVEALRHLPRPALVYTTLNYSDRSSNVRSVASWLVQAGFTAVKAVSGSSTGDERKHAVSGLSLAGRPEDDADIVVATSAFGMGIDIPDIRTVIHVCVPESIDRLYQEVGRSGRDGRAAASLVLWTRADAQVAEQVAQARLIGPDLAWTRWCSMRASVRTGEQLTVDLRASHDGVRYPSSEANRYWNTQTLAAMERAGMIERRYPDPPHIRKDDDEEATSLAFERFRESVTVVLLASDIGDEGKFRRRIAAARHSTLLASSAGLAAATQLVREHPECTNQYLARAYRIVDEDGSALPVEIACGGCPYCRACGVSRREPSTANLALGWGSIDREADADVATLGASGRLCVRRSSHGRRAERELLERLVRRGFRAIVASRGEADEIRPKATVPWWVDDVETWIRSRQPWRVPTVLIAGADLEGDLLAWALDKLSRQPFGVLMAAADHRDPRDLRRYLHEAWTPAYDIDSLLRRL